MAIKCKLSLFCCDYFYQWNDWTPCSYKVFSAYCLNRSANGVRTHLEVIDFSLLCCMIATPSPPLTGTTGNPLVKLVLTLTTHRVTTLETFSCWRGVVSSLSMYSMVYFLLSQQVLRRLPNIDSRKELWNCCTSLSLFIQDNTRQPPPSPRLLPHLFLTTLWSCPVGEFRC